MEIKSNQSAMTSKTLFIAVLVSIIPTLSILGFFIMTNLQAERILSDFKDLVSLNDYQSAEALYEKATNEALKLQLQEALELKFKSYDQELIKNFNQADVEPLNNIIVMKSLILSAINSEIDNILTQYKKGSLNDQNIINFSRNMQKIGFDLQSNQIFQRQLEQSLKAYYNHILHIGLDLESEKNYEAASTLFDEGLLYYPNDTLLQEKSLQAQIYAKQLAELIPYDGPIQHIFFHPLIAYPDLAFKGNQAAGYDDYFVTVHEFNQILESLYEKNFILIDINSMYEEKNISGEVVFAKRQLMLPPNKKPLIISIDDLNYYNYMRQNGNVYRLVLDNQGNIATYSVTPQGKERIACDNEIIPILDQYVKLHPDFSFLGVKGTIALTGYEGILGYRTDKLSSLSYSEDKDKALKVIARLKETGWNFASHSYGHPDMKKISYEQVVRDTNQWLKEVEPLIGETKIFVYPYGSSLKPEDPKFKYLYDHGFRVFNGVGPTSYIYYAEQYILQDRRHVDGIAFHQQRNLNLDLYDANKIIDNVRPDRY